MGLFGLIAKFLLKRLEAQVIRKSFPIMLTIFFDLLGVIFLALAVSDLLGIYLPSYLTKLLLAGLFFILAAIFKLRW